jgi:transposase InsO family protein
MQGRSLASLAAAFGCSDKTVGKWVRRIEAGESVYDRSSRPGSHPSQLSLAITEKVLRLRKERNWGPDRIAPRLGISSGACYKILRRHGCNRKSLFKPKKLHNKRYEYAEPGGLVHIDFAKIPRFLSRGMKFGGHHKQNMKLGYDYCFAAIDDCSRLATVRIYRGSAKEQAEEFLNDLVSHYGKQGITIRRIMTDNGSCFISRLFRDAAHERDIQIINTPVGTPQWNGKVERFFRTLNDEWVYRRVWDSSMQRNRCLGSYISWYNNHRTHQGIGNLTPIEKKEQRM